MTDRPVPSWPGGPRDDDPIVLVDADPQWPALFAGIAGRLAAALGDAATTIEHVGSTSIPGLPAKPVIDVQVSVRDIARIEAFTGPIVECGFPFHVPEPEFGHHFFCDQQRTAHVHVCGAGSDWERRHVLFRDYLRSHSSVAAEYLNLKRDLAARFTRQRDAYARAKSDFMERVEREAEAWAKETGWSLPPLSPSLPLSLSPRVAE